MSETALHRSSSAVARTLIAPIRFYQRFISPALPPSCRFYPTCSSYAVTALSEHGAVKGTWLTICRIGRCHPWHPGGFDPVPPSKSRHPELLSLDGSSPPESFPYRTASVSPDRSISPDRDESANGSSLTPDERPATAGAPTDRSSAA